MDKFFEITIDSITSSSHLLLVVLGFYIIYGIMKVINMAHGDLLMLGAYFTAYLSKFADNFWIGVIGATLLCFIIGVIIELIIKKTLFLKDKVTTLLATWGISLIIIELVKLGFGSTGIYVDAPFSGTIAVLSTSMPIYKLLIILIAIIVTAFFAIILEYTRFGIVLKAAIENPKRSYQFLIKVGSIYSLGFGIGAAMAGFAGAIISPFTAITPDMGVDYAFLSFLVVISGGFRSIWSAVIGSVVVASVRTVIGSFLDSTTATVGMLCIVLIIILIKPGGLLPESEFSN